MKKYLEIVDRFLPIVVSLASVLIIVTGYDYAWKMVTGWLEPKWAAEGLTMTNKNIKFLLAFIFVGAGIPYIMFTVTIKKSHAWISTMIVLVPVVITMTMNEVYTWAASTVVLVIAFAVAIKKMKKNRLNLCRGE